MVSDITIDPQRKYTRNEVKTFLEFEEDQLKLAEKNNLISFFGATIYGIYFFQFLKTNYKKLEEIKQGTL
jgi:hypothetical protein